MAWLEKRGGVFQICWREANGQKQRKSTGQPDKANARIMLGDFNRAAKDGSAGALDKFKASKARPLAEHIADYLADVRARGRAKLYVYHLEKRLAKLTAACKWSHWPDITADTFSTWRETPIKQKQALSEDGRIGAATANQYLEAARSFCAWMVKRGRMPANPLASIGKMQEGADVRRHRRALTEEEITKLLNAAGPYALVYRFLLGTGLRRAEAKQLLWGDLHLEATSPYLTLRAQTTKAKRADSLPLRHDLARCLQGARGDAADDNRVFALIPGMKRHKTILKRAGVEWETEAGLADLHSLRHTFGTMLSKSGVAPRVAMSLMRHTDMRLTMNVYTDPRIFDLAGAVAMLPTIGGGDRPQSMKATGTDGADQSADLMHKLAAPVGAKWGARPAIMSRISPEVDPASGTGESEESIETAGARMTLTGVDGEKEKMRHVGLEPTTL